ncbi:glycosyltransferase [Aquisalimonas lutea]|uniref:glycosyltransferase n=1 Tax=Aquisalimonas lutea TaxID=1327750 RepID=UPI0025B28341|nr:glycosyltransferase [Aquisalimonas lutea]MDN3516816.1 glycosyltransferase [Aquisalimonas lutea]
MAGADAEAGTARQQRLAVLIAFTGDGGVENMVTNLLHGFVAEGVAVDLLLLKGRGGHLDRIPAAVRIHHLNARTSLQALPAVMRYLRRERPKALLVAKDRASRVALLARRLTGVDTRVVLRMGMHLSGSLAGKSALRRWSRYLPVRWLYPWADAIVTVADAVADDLARIGNIPRERFTVIRNPTIPPDLEARTQAPAAHPWLPASVDAPVFLGVGRFTAQKDFATLLRAFAALRRSRPGRLILLGDGPERDRLETLARELGIGADVAMPGFRDNPWAWMARSSVFVLSSRWEGAPNVLVEAMAAGTPVVATDCPSGPAEILDHGRIAPLVPVGDAHALAAAMGDALDRPPDPARLRAAVADYRLPASTRRYLEVLGY